MNNKTPIGYRTATLFLVILLSGLAESTQAQIFRQYDVRPEGFGARALATADATVADASDITSMYWNPAAIEFLSHTNLVLNSTLDADSQVLKSGFVMPFRLGRDQMIAVGLVASYFGSPLSKPDFASYGFDVAFASRIFVNVGAGALLNVRHGSKFGDSFKSGILSASGSLGLFYSPNPGISYGISYRGIGSGMVFSQGEGSILVEYERQIPQSIEAGITFRYPSSAKRPIAVLSMTVEKSILQSGAKNKAGLEITPFDFLSFRMGVLTNNPTTVYRTGVGIYLFGFLLDYGLSSSSSASGQALSISVPLAK